MTRTIKTLCALTVIVGCTQTPEEVAPPASGGSSGTGGAGGSGGTVTAGTSGVGVGGAMTGGTGGTTGGAGPAGAGGSAGMSTGGVGGVNMAGTGAGGTPPATGGMAGTTTAGTGGDGGVGAGAGAGGTSGAGPAGASGDGGTAGAPTGGFVTCPYVPPADPTAANFTAAPTTLFNNNGAWTWYSDERAIVDVAGGKILVSSDANAQGPSGGSRDGTVEVVSYDIATKTVGSPFVLGDLAPDDHNNAGLLVKAEGGYLAFWAGHNENCNSYWRNHDGTNWGASQTFNWTSNGCPFENGRQITYNNVWNMSAEGKIYNFVRSVGTSPNLLVSDDNGATWEYGGRLSSTPTVGYVAGYYKYWGNQVDRIDLFATEAHPRDNDNNLYHAYLKGGKTYTSTNVEVDANISDGTSPQVTAFTKIFSTGTQLAGATMNHAWNSDIVRYDDGTIVAIGMARTQNDGNNPDHAFLYFRFDGSTWTTTYLGKAGKKLYDSEQDYVGLGAVHPDDPRIIYISSHIDPRDDSALDTHEIFMGVTCDEGATFEWTPITWNSTKQNLRPIVPKWNGSNMALLWFRGSYSTAQIYNEEVVGIVTQN